VRIRDEPDVALPKIANGVALPVATFRLVAAVLLFIAFLELSSSRLVERRSDAAKCQQPA
jgi:hypothetical protein